MSLVDLGKKLLDAAKTGSTDEVRHLMSSGAPFTTDWLGTSPLHFAAQYGHYETADVLLRAGISRDARTKVDRTPLHVAAQEGHLSIVQLLLSHNADIEAKDMLKMTPLHWAVERENLEVIEFLLKNNAEATCENKFDKSAIDLARSKQRHDIMQMILMMQPNGGLSDVCVEGTEQTIAEEVTATTALEEDMTGELIMDHTNIKKEKLASTEEIEDNTEQSSTSVLATLAALAEATAPLSSGSASGSQASDALNWLETHGITMISGNDSIASQIEAGQTLTLTEAGKLALKYAKQSQKRKMSHTEHMTVMGSDGTKEIIEIRTAATGDEGNGDEMLVISAEETDVIEKEVEATEEEEDLEEIAGKRIRLSSGDSLDGKSDMPMTNEALRAQLAKLQKEAAVYKKELQKKEREANKYKEQLISKAASNS